MIWKKVGNSQAKVGSGQENGGSGEEKFSGHQGDQVKVCGYNLVVW